MFHFAFSSFDNKKIQSSYTFSMTSVGCTYPNFLRFGGGGKKELFQMVEDAGMGFQDKEGKKNISTREDWRSSHHSVLLIS